MNKKLVAIDIDGTLINSNYEISTKVLQSFLKFKDHGIFILATGRPPRSVISYYKELRLDSPLILYNGQFIKEEKNNNIQWQYRFPLSLVEQFFTYIKAYSSTFISEDDEHQFFYGDNPFLFSYFPKMENLIHTKKPSDVLFQDPWTAIFSCDTPLTKKKAIEFIEKCSYSNIGIRFWSGSAYGEFYDKRANKGVALEYLQDYFHITKDHSYAVGDSLNDLEMLKVVGHPFVMKNTKNHALKEKFPVTRAGNDEDGLAYLFEEIFA